MKNLKKPDVIKKLPWIYDTSTDEILAEIEKAINAAVNNPDINKREAFLSYFGGSTPTPEEFSHITSEAVRKKADKSK